MSEISDLVSKSGDLLSVLNDLQAKLGDLLAEFHFISQTR